MFTFTSDILLGKSNGFTDLPTFGIMKGTPRHYIRRLVSRLTFFGYIRDDDGLLSTTPMAKEVLLGGVTVMMRGYKPSASKKAERARKQAQEPRYAISEGLFSKLKELRLSIAREENVPAFVVFSDATLVDMCQKHPRTEEEMLSVSGVGNVKMERYGERFLEVFRAEESNSQSQEELPEFTAELFFQQVETEDTPLQISRVADNINYVLIRYGKPKISGMKLNGLLLEAGCLEMVDGVKLPTEQGSSVGITTIKRHSERGDYMQCLFGPDAQQVCLELALKEIGISDKQ
jgi:ATP-dependent DNA helicase RecQ